MRTQMKQRKMILLMLLLCIIIVLRKLKQKKKHKRWANRRWYIRPINQNRLQQGENNNLFKELKKSQDKRMFSKYSRMQRLQFDKILYFLHPHLTKISKRALILEERLLITLRYLATGNSISSIAFSF